MTKQLKYLMLLTLLLVSVHTWALPPPYSMLGRIFANDCQRALMPQWHPRDKAYCIEHRHSPIHEQSGNACNYYALAALLEGSPAFVQHRIHVSVPYMIIMNHLNNIFKKIISSASRTNITTLDGRALRSELAGFDTSTINETLLVSYIVSEQSYTPHIDIESYIETGALAEDILSADPIEIISLISNINNFVNSLSSFESLLISTLFTSNNLQQRTEVLALRAQFINMTFNAAHGKLAQRTPTSSLIHHFENLHFDEYRLHHMQHIISDESLPTFEDINTNLVSFEQIQEKIEASLQNNTPVLLGLHWPDTLIDADGVLYIKEHHILQFQPQAIELNDSRHSVVIVNVFKNSANRVLYYQLQNSWGTAAGNGGYFYITPGYLNVLADSFTFLTRTQP